MLIVQIISDNDVCIEFSEESVESVSAVSNLEVPDNSVVSFVWIYLRHTASLTTEVEQWKHAKSWCRVSCSYTSRSMIFSASVSRRPRTEGAYRLSWSVRLQQGHCTLSYRAYWRSADLSLGQGY